MWTDIEKYLAQFPSAVLTGVDAEGYPFSIRCHPLIDHAQKHLRIEQTANTEIQPGPASLMCHSHDELFWDLKSFLLRGHLEQDEEGYIFQPNKLIVSGGLSSPLDQMKFMIKARKMTKRYLAKRGLPRPKVPWDDIKALWVAAKKAGYGNG